MNYLDKSAKKNMFSKKKQKIVNLKSFWPLTVLGVAIGGAAIAFFTKNYCEEIKNIDINNVVDNPDYMNDNIDKDIEENDENIEDDNNINTDKIMETLEHVGEESLGDVGLAMEEALEELEDVNQSENKIKN
ncbi:hypothetical protein G9F72_012365 [Clostridium estertheticum]|uniref:hypothetical protein n=1 Tax=Clostridium estertheticum TaxID=238834 RepID=UPI0013E99CA7|nr:hypothetical protein [Clostridium estertheticum]MBZ9687118.1 hypothetical protein [Clostridium estertheticum]